MKNISFVVLVGILGSMCFTGVSFAQTAQATQAQLNLLSQLLDQLHALQSQLATLRGATAAAPTMVSSLSGTFSQGSQSKDIKVLQAILATDGTIYPEGLITGYFGPATARAVKNFQKTKKLKQSGKVDAKTLTAINALLTRNPLAIESSGSLCAAITQGVTLPSGWLRQQSDGALLVPRCVILPQGVSDQTVTGSTTVHTSPTSIINQTAIDRTAPIISNVSSSATINSATIKWTTDKDTQSQVEWWPQSIYVVGTLNSWSDTEWVTTHTQKLTSLATSTVYYVRITAKDSSGNITIYPEQIIKTSDAPDKTSPVISNIAVTNQSGSSAIISWKTNELAKAKIYYGTTNPLRTSATTTQTIASSILSTSTSMILSGLDSLSTYYYLIQVTDEAGNKATSEQGTFYTLGQ